jgi:hypothetical protein
MRCTSTTRKSCNSIRPLDTTERAQWLKVAQFQTEDWAQQFREDFMLLVRTDELSIITGPALAVVIADDLEKDSRRPVMDKQTLEKRKAEEWTITHQTELWQNRLDEVSPQQALEATNFDLDL